MGVAKTMGQKLQYKLSAGQGNRLSMEELAPRDSFITPQSVRMNQLKDRLIQANGLKYGANISKLTPHKNIRMDDFMGTP